MLLPQKTKYRKQFKGRIHGSAKGNFKLNFGSYGLKALEPERITSRQIESARKAITRHLKRAGRLWIRIFPDVGSNNLLICLIKVDFPLPDNPMTQKISPGLT